ncbi:hypothetical protein [Paraburkholderia terrae]|uniref:hypothetical protein n=1 Tax=Paraburkholderia terrae TaxID=311230 RepID=UPI001EE35593|nr:hypothetical protein [Paraburkholderia terrae]GJH05899.1 hypothetical protein CBA19C8_35100 [Paraburkholderia terrae]
MQKAGDVLFVRFLSGQRQALEGTLEEERATDLKLAGFAERAGNVTISFVNGYVHRRCRLTEAE